MKKTLFSFLALLLIIKSQSQCPGNGNINYQRWNNISGGSVSNLTSNSNYPNNPSSSGTRTLFEMPQTLDSNFGIKMYGYICAPATGNYIFWIAANTSAELWLSTSSGSFEKVRIAYNINGTSSREWNKYASQKSVSITMTIGQKYYVEALMKESTSNDNLAVGWAKPGQSTSSPSEVIPGSSLSVNSNTDTQAPSATTNLSSANITTNSFTLSWTAATDNVAVTGYDVYNNGIKVNTANITATSYNVTGLSPNTSYSMTVKAKDAAANESNSSPFSVTTKNIPDTQPPSAPTNLSSANITTSYFTLSWTAATDNVAVTGYDIYSNGVKVNTANITATSYSVTGLSPNSTYSITVRAKDAAANELSSTPLSVTTNDIPDIDSPSVPTGLVAANIINTFFTLSWSAATDNVAVTGYDVYSNGIKINTVNIPDTSYSVTGLSPNSTYSMTVRAKDDAANESNSSPLLVTTNNIPDTQAPSAPTNLSASAITTTSFTLTWRAATDNVAVTGYDVYKNGIKINTANITAISLSVTGLSPDTTYTMAVRANDASGNVTTSSSLPVTTPDTQAPAAPTNLSAANLTGSSFTLTWTAAIDNVAVTGYDVYRNGVKLNTVNIPVTSCNITGLWPNNTYTMTVRAKDAAGNETASSPLPVTTQASASTAYLTLPLAAAMTLSNQSNVVIENLRFENITGAALNIFGSNNITIRNCFFNKATEEAINIETSANITIEYCLFNGVTTGIYVLKTQNINVRNNQFVNVRRRVGGSRGQFVQFNEVTGAGNAIENNTGENFPGESDPEDLISLYKSAGTSASPLSVRNNMFRGGGPSTSGSGIVVGDNGGNNTVIENNTLLDPGQAGIAIAGGKDILVLNNKIYATQQPFTNNPLYVWNQSDTTSSNITVKDNRVNWRDKTGERNNGWNAGNCSSTLFEAPTTITLAEMNVPAHLITLVTEAELLMIRGSVAESKQAKEFLAFNRMK